MFDLNYYNELLRLAYLHMKYMKFKQYLNSNTASKGSKARFEKKLAKHHMREAEMNELIYKHQDYYVYYMYDVMGKNMIKKYDLAYNNFKDYTYDEIKDCVLKSPFGKISGLYA